MILMLILWVCIVAAARMGWQAGTFPKRQATLVAGIFCTGLVLGAFASWRLEWLPELLITATTAYLQGSWFAPLAVGLFFIATRQVLERGKSTGNMVRQVWLFKLLSVVVMAVASIGLLDRLGWYGGVSGDMSAEPHIDADGIVLQSTLYTCGAAACANLLRRTGVDGEATEQQLAPLCITRRYDGASTLGMAAGLKSIASAKGWHVRVVHADWPELCRLKMPVLAAYRIHENCSHAVVLVNIDAPKGIQIADPLSGLHWLPEAQFRAKFDNEVVALYRDDPYR